MAPKQNVETFTSPIKVDKMGNCLVSKSFNFVGNSFDNRNSVDGVGNQSLTVAKPEKTSSMLFASKNFHSSRRSRIERKTSKKFEKTNSD